MHSQAGWRNGCGWGSGTLWGASREVSFLACASSGEGSIFLARGLAPVVARWIEARLGAGASAAGEADLFDVSREKFEETSRGRRERLVIALDGSLPARAVPDVN